MINLYKLCWTYDLQIKMIKSFDDGVIFKFYDKHTDHAYNFMLSAEELQKINANNEFEFYENRLIEEVINMLRLDKEPCERELLFTLDTIEPDEVWRTCGACNGTGFTQIAPGVRGIERCQSCDGKGKIRIK